VLRGDSHQVGVSEEEGGVGDPDGATIGFTHGFMHCPLDGPPLHRTIVVIDGDIVVSVVINVLRRPGSRRHDEAERATAGWRRWRRSTARPAAVLADAQPFVRREGRGF